MKGFERRIGGEESLGGRPSELSVVTQIKRSRPLILIGGSVLSVYFFFTLSAGIAKWAMCRWTLGTIERRCGVTVLVKPLPESPGGVAVF